MDEELVFFLWMYKLVRFFVVGDSRDDEVDVGVVLHLAAPGVEDTGGSEAGLWFFEFGTDDVAEGGEAFLEEEVVEFGGMLKAEGAEFGWDGKGDEEVRDRQ